MEAVQERQVVERDGEVLIAGITYNGGEAVEVIAFPQPPAPLPRVRLTVGQLRRSGLIGMWADHDDIEDSAVFARQLRERVQQTLTPPSTGQRPAPA